MKHSIIFCLVLGILHIQVDANPVSQTIDTYKNYDVDLQKRFNSFLSEMIHIANEIRHFIIVMYYEDNEYFKYKKEHVNKVMKEWSFSSNATNLTKCVATSTEANEHIKTVPLSWKNGFSNCLNTFLDDIEQLKEGTVKNITKQKNLFDMLNITKSQVDYLNFINDIMHRTEFAVKWKLLVSEITYMKCIQANMSINNHVWDLIEVSILYKCTDRKSLEELFPLPSVNIQYEKEKDLEELLRTHLSNLNNVVRETNSSIARIHEKRIQYREYKINRTDELLKKWSYDLTAPTECTEQAKNLTELFQSLVLIDGNPYHMNHYCFEKFQEELRRFKRGLARFEENPLELAKEKLTVPTRQVAWQEFMFEQFYRIERSTNQWMGEQMETFFKCTEWKTINLEKSLNFFTESIVNHCGIKTDINSTFSSPAQYQSLD